MTVDPIVPGFVHLMRGFLSTDECDSWIRWSEARGYEQALLSDGSRREDVRNNDRLIFDDPYLAGDWSAGRSRGCRACRMPRSWG